MGFREFDIIHKACGKKAKIVSAYEASTYDDVDPDIILKIRCDTCDETYREKL